MKTLVIRSMVTRIQPFDFGEAVGKLPKEPSAIHVFGLAKIINIQENFSIEKAYCSKKSIPFQAFLPDTITASSTEVCAKNLLETSPQILFFWDSMKCPLLYKFLKPIWDKRETLAPKIFFYHKGTYPKVIKEFTVLNPLRPKKEVETQ